MSTHESDRTLASFRITPKGEQEENTTLTPSTLHTVDVIDALKNQGYFTLPAGITVLVQVTTVGAGGGRDYNLSGLILEEPIDVDVRTASVTYDKEKEQEPGSALLVPLTEAMRPLAGAMYLDNLAFNNPYITRREAVERARPNRQRFRSLQRAFAQSFLNGKEHLIETHGLTNDQVQEVMFNVNLDRTIHGPFRDPHYGTIPHDWGWHFRENAGTLGEQIKLF